jgi:hypothetical protein
MKVTSAHAQPRDVWGARLQLAGETRAWAASARTWHSTAGPDAVPPPAVPAATSQSNPRESQIQQVISQK